MVSLVCLCLGWQAAHRVIIVKALPDFLAKCLQCGISCSDDVRTTLESLWTDAARAVPAKIMRVCILVAEVQDGSGVGSDGEASKYVSEICEFCSSFGVDALVDSKLCEETQVRLGCHRCQRKGCWQRND